MKPSQIVVGKRYTNSYFGPSMVWLGCGRRKLFTTDQFVDKFLVCIEGDAKYIGFIFQNPAEAHDGYWDAFQDADSQTWIMFQR